MLLWLPRRLAIVLGTAVLLSAALSAQPGKPVSDRDPSVLARLADDARVALSVPGLSVAVGAGDVITWAQGFGVADLEQNVPVRPETVFRLASISKPITATAVMQLVERGLVSLEDPIQRFVPGFPRKSLGEVRIRHLLSHTSGIRHYRGDEFTINDYYPSLERAMAVFKDDPLLFAPGDQYHYSTYGYNLLAGVVESVSARSFDAHLRANIFAPAGMSSTLLERPQELVRYRARQYVRGPSPMTWLNAPYVDLSVKWAGGGLIATAGDLIRFDIALNAGRLLGQDTQDRMYTPTRLNSGALTGYGLGWMIRQDAGRLKVAHSGGAAGGTTYLIREPRARLASVVLANQDNVPRLGELADQLMTLAPRPVSSSTR